MSSLTGPVLAEYQDLFSQSDTQGGPNGGLNLGAKAYTGDGREYRFVLAGALALVPGTLLQNSAEVTGLEDLAFAAAAIGATQVTTTTTVTVAVNALRGGYLVGTVTAGQGYMYKISGNKAASGAVTTIYLEDPLQVALTTGSRADAVANPYRSVIINPTVATGAPIGAAIYPVAAGKYGWAQVSGPATLLADGAVVVGTQVVASNATAGAVEAATGIQAAVGNALEGIATTEYGLIALNLP